MVETAGVPLLEIATSGERNHGCEQDRVGCVHITTTGVACLCATDIRRGYENRCEASGGWRNRGNDGQVL